MSEALVTPVDRAPSRLGSTAGVRIEHGKRVYYAQALLLQDGDIKVTVAFTYPCCRRPMTGKSRDSGSWTVLCQRHQRQAVMPVPIEWYSHFGTGMSLQAHLAAFYDAWGANPLSAVLEAEEASRTIMAAALAHRKALLEGRLDDLQAIFDGASQRH